MHNVCLKLGTIPEEATHQQEIGFITNEGIEGRITSEMATANQVKLGESSKSSAIMVGTQVDMNVTYTPSHSQIE